MQHARPRVAWIGPKDARLFLEEVGKVAAVCNGWDPEAVLVLVWAPLGPVALHRLPEEARGVPVLAICPDAPATNERMIWIEAGAEDLVAGSVAARAVTAWLRALGWHADFLGFSDEQASADADAPPAATGADPFPPVRIAYGDSTFLSDSLQWVQALQRYLAQRHSFIRKYGRGSLPAFLELSHFRDTVASCRPGSARANIFGQVPAGPTPSLGWPIAVRRAARDPGTGMVATPCKVVSVGSDGLLIEVAFRSLPRQKLVCDLPVNEAASAQLMVEARMQRRVGVDLWHVGAMVLEMRLRPYGE